MEETKPEAIIFDIDGTLAHMTGRKERRGKNAPYMDWDAHDDEVDEHVELMLNTLKKNFKIIICSGRKSESRDVLEKWLDVNGIHYDEIFMRAKGDNRKDSIIKRELYENEIAPKYDVKIVFDDRDQVVDMWRNELGLKVFQVAEGKF